MNQLAGALNLNKTASRLLVQRGISSVEEVRKFLDPRLDHLHNPLRLTDLGLAMDRLMRAIHVGESIVVHGDYDVDGITSTVILQRVLELLGGNVSHYIPNRLTDGYGLRPETIDRFADQGHRVIVTVDCGIRSLDAAKRAKKRAVDLIITDHHEPGDLLPDAFAVINPRRYDCDYPEKNLSGVGVAFKLVQALCSRSGRDEWIGSFIKIAAIGTVADIVPLVGENRTIAKIGLDKLSQGRNSAGLNALLESSGLEGRRITSQEVSFSLAPRLNAAGRMSTPELAVQLLMQRGEKGNHEARRLASEIEQKNSLRRETEAAIVSEARIRIEKSPQLILDPLLVVWDDKWHRGVIGIVAAKLVEMFGRPAIVFSIDGELSYGSCRSVPGLDILDNLEKCSELCVQLGGHRYAAGLTVETCRLEELRTCLNRNLKAAQGSSLQPQELIIDGSLRLSQINEGLMDDLRRMEPFGSGNRRPVFLAEAVKICDGPRQIGEQHLRMTFRQEGCRVRGVAWRVGEERQVYQQNGSLIDIVFSLAENHFRSETFIELSIEGAKKHG